MAGTVEGGRKAAETNKKRHGIDFYKINGAIGGSHGKGHKFGHGKLDPVAEGIKGGKAGSRSWSKQQRKEHSYRMRELYKSKWAYKMEKQF